MGSEKYQRRQRFIYALIFKNRTCYIGQSVDVQRRFKQHQASGDWRSLGTFSVRPLGAYMGTYADLEEWEYAWRLAAQRSGWKVYGGSDASGPYLVDPRKRSNNRRLALSKKCHWPGSGGQWWPIPLTLAAGIALAASGWLTHAVEQAKFLLGQ